MHAHWACLEQLEKDVRELVGRAHLIGDRPAGKTLTEIIDDTDRDIRAKLAPIKDGWRDRAEKLHGWFDNNRAAINGATYRPATVSKFFDALTAWACDDDQVWPDEGFYNNDAWDKWGHEKLVSACKKACTYSSAPPAEFALITRLKRDLDALPQISHSILAHAAVLIAQRMDMLKFIARKFGFADMLSRLKAALEGENSAALRARIVARYPVALIDEFQDTSPDQYRIFDTLYNVAGDKGDDEPPRHGLMLIGDPKQAIYGFRGADIYSYLAARRATEGRHYRLGVNYRSTNAVVNAVNCLFSHAEGHDGASGHPKGAFGFRSGQDNPLPFERVSAHDRKDRLMQGGKEVCAMTVWIENADEAATAGELQHHFAAVCAEQIVGLLNDASVQFQSPDGRVRLQPADIAVLVKNKYEAGEIQRALKDRDVPSVYLSDKDSVFKSDEASDVLRWLAAVSSPLNVALARCAFATRTAGLSIAELAMLNDDDLAWEARIEQLKQLRQAWQQHGVLAMLRRFIHELRLPETLFAQPGGERSLTNLLHLAELLQAESHHLDGEQALIRWLAEQIDSDLDGGEEHILRLESEAQLVKIITIHKSKGLEYPLVFLPFAAACRPVTRKNKTFFECTDAAGTRRIDLTLSDTSLQAMEVARIEEDLRLLYVALTRARHALWLGVAASSGNVHLSALGYLINGGTKIAAAELKETIAVMCSGCTHIAVLDAPAHSVPTRLSRPDERAALQPPAIYDSDFDRDWSVASYSSITKYLASARAPATRTEQKILEEGGDVAAAGAVQNMPWHRFPRGQIPGLFLHSVLEWMAEQGLSNFLYPQHQTMLVERCERSNWKESADDLVAWMTETVQTVLPPLNTRLCDIGQLQVEAEFWLPTDQLLTAELDRMCREGLLQGQPRPAILQREISGMLRGFMDLVFEHNGRYWILDYKSTALGNHDNAYHPAALQAAVLEKRYEVQGMIYLLALHRVLKIRLGREYDPSQHLGGALFLFLRGIGNPETRGCCHLMPEAAWLEAFDALLPMPQLEQT